MLVYNEEKLYRSKISLYNYTLFGVGERNYIELRWKHILVSLTFDLVGELGKSSN